MNYTLNEMLSLAQNPALYKQAILNCTKATEQRVIKNITNTIPPVLLSDSTFVDRYSDLVLLFSHTWKKVRLSHTKILRLAFPFLNTIARTILINTLDAQFSKYSTYIKRELLGVICGDIQTEDRARYVLERDYRLLSVQQIERILSFIPNQQDPAITKRLQKSAYVSVLYKDMGNVTDQAQKLEFVKNLIATPTLLKNITTPIAISVDDLKALPSTMRFQLLRMMFEDVFNWMEYEEEESYSYSRYYYYNAASHNRTAEYVAVLSKSRWFSKVLLGPITDEEMRMLLFSQAIKNNQEMKEWFDKYQAFVKEKPKIHETLKRILDMMS